jgi:hypothetical protein
MKTPPEACDRCNKPMPGGEGYAGSMDWWLCEACTDAVREFVKRGSVRTFTLEAVEGALEVPDLDAAQFLSAAWLKAFRAALEEK